MYTCYAYPKVCKFKIFYFICTLGYIQDVSIFGKVYVPKIQVVLYIYNIGLWVFPILPISWNVDHKPFSMMIN